MRAALRLRDALVPYIYTCGAAALWDAKYIRGVRE